MGSTPPNGSTSHPMGNPGSTTHWQIQGGHRQHVPSPTGSISFVFTYVFAKKCMHWGLAPPNGSAPPNGKSWIRHCHWYIFHLLYHKLNQFYHADIKCEKYLVRKFTTYVEVTSACNFCGRYLRPSDVNCRLSSSLETGTNATPYEGCISAVMLMSLGQTLLQWRPYGPTIVAPHQLRQ